MSMVFGAPANFDSAIIHTAQPVVQRSEKSTIVEAIDSIFGGWHHSYAAGTPHIRYIPVIFCVKRDPSGFKERSL